MALKSRVESLDSIPEALHDYYSKSGDGFVLDVSEPDLLPGVRGMKTALEDAKAKRDRYKEQLSAYGDRSADEIAEVLEEVERLRDSKGGEPTAEQVEAIEKKVAAKYEKQYGPKIERADRMESLLKKREVTSAIDGALDAAGFDPRHKPVLRAYLLAKEPKVVETDDGFAGVFSADVNGIPGDHGISDYVSEWAKTDEALAYRPAKGTGGSGSPAEGGGSGPTTPGTVSRSDPMAFARAAADIAAGKVTVSD